MDVRTFNWRRTSKLYNKRLEKSTGHNNLLGNYRSITLGKINNSRNNNQHNMGCDNWDGRLSNFQKIHFQDIDLSSLFSRTLSLHSISFLHLALPPNIIISFLYEAILHLKQTYLKTAILNSTPSSFYTDKY